MNASFYHGRFFGVVSLALLTAFVSTAGIYLMNLEGKHEMIRVQLEERVEKNELSTPSSADIVYELQFQRNYLSRLLDSTIAQLNRLKCSQGSMTAKSGGWCNEAIKDKHTTDWALVPALRDLFQNKTVASFGEGPGIYKQELKDYVRLYDAFDGSPFIENITDGQVAHLDLSVPQYGLKAYDWVFSLEVAEHIEAEFEEIFVSNLVRHAKIGLVLSWAIPGQPGFQHVNGRHFTYVARTLAHLCFKHDWQLTDKIQRAATLPWLKANTNVYLRSGCPLNDLLI